MEKLLVVIDKKVLAAYLLGVLLMLVPIFFLICEVEERNEIIKKYFNMVRTYKEVCAPPAKINM
jgi:hypothetical protein